MGCIQASAYTTGTILGTYSGVDALDQCNNFCGVCCIPQCDGICEYCMTWVGAARAHGTYVVTGDVTITYTDPINPCDPWHGGPDTTNYTHTFTINGTYTWDGGYSYYWTNNSDNRVYIDGSQGWDTLGVWIDSPNSYGWPIIDGMIRDGGTGSWYGPGYGGMSWEPGCGSEFDWGDFTVGSSLDGLYVYYPTTFDPETGQCVPDYESPTRFPAGFTITGSTINIKFIPSTENQSVCENAGGIFFGLDYYWNSTPNPYQAVDSCLFQTYATTTLVAECPPPIQLGGNYLDVTQSEPYAGLPAYYTNLLNGSCCEGICTQPYIKSSSTLGYCYDANYCVGFSPVPTTLGCNDTIGQSGCVQGGVYSPPGVPIGVWHSGTSCANFDCNPCITDSDCQYCETVWGVTPEYSEWGVRTVSGAAIINYSSTDPNDPLNGPHDPNGTYYPWFLDAGNMWYGKDHTDETIVGNPIGAGIYFVLSPNAPSIGNNDIKIAKSPYDFLENMWTNGDGAFFGCYDGSISYSGHVASTGTSVVVGGETITLTPASITDPIVTISYPTINSSTNKTVCETNNGVFFPVGWNPTFWGGLSVCEIYERVASSSATCTQSEYIGGNYNITPASISGPFGGSCCGLCYPPEGIDSSGCYTNVCPPNQ